MEKFLERHKLPKLNQETDNLKSHISVKEMEYMVKYLSTKKIQGSNGFAGEFYQTFKEKTIPTTQIPFLHKLHKKLEKERILSNLCY